MHEADASLFRHGGERRPVADIQVFLVHAQVGAPRRPLAQLDRPLGEEDLVGEDQEAALALGLLHLRQ